MGTLMRGFYKHDIASIVLMRASYGGTHLLTSHLGLSPWVDRGTPKGLGVGSHPADV